jgi:arylformamidase
MPKYLDISVPLEPGITVFPGDPSFSLRWPNISHAAGDCFNVGYFEGGIHLGTHVDAPFHLIRNGKQLHELSLAHWVGDCCVVDCSSAEVSVTGEHLDEIYLGGEIAKRIILKTRNTGNPYWRHPWNRDAIYLHESGAQWLVDHQVLTVGIDYLSIDPIHLAEAPAHNILLSSETCIIETLDLRGVLPGRYQLIAAPIPIHHADGAWCRALLQEQN